MRSGLVATLGRVRQSHLAQVIVAAGAAVGLATVREPGAGGSVWSGAEPYAAHALAGAAAGFVFAVALLLLLRARRRTPGTSVPPRREAISERVRHEVWRRDRGSCVECGSRGRLEFDHIIPVVRGGSNTVRNIELRCEPCNRRKGARV
jgi:hypothetical protein